MEDVSSWDWRTGAIVVLNRAWPVGVGGVNILADFRLLGLPHRLLLDTLNHSHPATGDQFASFFVSTSKYVPEIQI